jgi:NADPH2:quinone reductase
MKTAVVRIHRHGGPEVLQYEEVDLHEPGPGEVLMRQTAIGLNFADIYQREGEAGPHESQPMPIVLGGQGAGVIEAVGPGVANFKPGDMVAYIYSGAYAERNGAPFRLRDCCIYRRAYPTRSLPPHCCVGSRPNISCVGSIG